MSKIENQVIKKIQSRAEIGESKYGVTMERKDLSLCDWITHLQEELLDASIYAEKLKEDAKIFTCTNEVMKYIIDTRDITPGKATRQDLLDIIDELLILINENEAAEKD